MMQERISIPSFFSESCAAQSIKTTGNAAGFNDSQTFTGLYVSPGLFPDTMQQKGIGALTACVASAIAGLGAIVWFSF